MNKIFYAIIAIFIFCFASAYAADMKIIEQRIDRAVKSGDVETAQKWASLKLTLTQCERDKQAAQVLYNQDEFVERFHKMLFCAPRIIDTIQKYIPKETLDEDGKAALNCFKAIVKFYFHPDPEEAEALTKNTVNEFVAADKAREERWKKEEAARAEKRKKAEEEYRKRYENRKK